MKKNLADLRREYTLEHLTRRDVDPDPIRQFQRWLDQAVETDLPEPTATTLATVGADGRPAARMVLLKDVGERGFSFYTNLESRKGRELVECRRAALVFFWAELERQVRIEGIAERVEDAVADAYFQSRPRGSQLGAWASRQSEVVESRDVLERRVEELERAYRGRDVPRPPHWGGFRVVPDSIEFWQGRPNRLHDRILYTRLADGRWRIDRLSP